MPPVLVAMLVGAALLATGGAPTAPGGVARASGTRAISPFPAIHSPIPSDYDHYQLKFTVLGPQLKIIPSCGVVSALRVGGFVLSEFVDFERTARYRNDDLACDTLVISSGEFQAYVDALALRPAFHDTSLVADPEVSLMILRDYGPASICWEHQTTTQAETDTLIQVLINSVTDPVMHARLHSIRHHLAGIRR